MVYMSKEIQEFQDPSVTKHTVTLSLASEKAIFKFKALHKQNLSEIEAFDYYKTLDTDTQKEPWVINHLLNFSSNLFYMLDDKSQNDITLIKFLVKKNPKLYSILPEEMKQDLSIIYSALDSDTKNTKTLLMILESNPKLSFKKQFILKTVGIDGHYLDTVPEEMKKDSDVILTAVKQSIGALLYVPEYVQEFPEKLVALHFVSFVCFAHKMKDYNPSIKNILLHLEQNKNIDFYHEIENQFLNHWDENIEQLSKEIKFEPKFIKIGFELNRHLSYMMPHWKKENIQTFLKKSHNLSNEKIKKALYPIFEKEINRKNIADITMFEKRKQNRTQKTRRIGI
jgi:hypothetical protein